MNILRNIIIAFSLLISCSSTDSVFNGLTDHQWRLVSIQLENETINISENSYVKPSSYILKFPDNATFILDTSINAAAGNYTINGDRIELDNYQELSEAATNDPEQLRINDFLLQQLERVIRFTINQDELILYTQNEVLIFKRN